MNSLLVPSCPPRITALSQKAFLASSTGWRKGANSKSFILQFISYLSMAATISTMACWASQTSKLIAIECVMVWRSKASMAEESVAV
eukprot:7218961-Pyramimonas_sp.AAC.1